MLRSAIIGLVVGATFIVAGQVGDLIQFQPNTTAKSSEVNENFNRIKDAVNDNYSRIQNLQNSVNDHESRIQSLEDFDTNLQNGCPTGQVMKGVGSDGTPQCSQVQPNELARNPAIPIAFGSVLNNCTIRSGSGNFSCTWNSSLSRYEITINGEDYLHDNYVTVVTPSGGTAIGVRTGSVSGKLLIYLYDNSGGLVQSHFSFVVFKP